MHILHTAIIEGAEFAPGEGSMHGVMIAIIATPNGSAEQFSGGVGIVTGRVKVLHLGTEVQARTDIAGEEEADVVLFMSVGESAFVSDGGEGCGGIEIAHLLWRNDIGGPGGGEGIVDGGSPVLYDTTLDGRDEYVSVKSAAHRVSGLDVDIEEIDYRGVGAKGDGIRDGAEGRHIPISYNGLDTRCLGSDRKGRCQQH